MMRWFGRRGRGNDTLVTASELASFVYCPEQWRLEHGLGLPPENRAALDAGTRHHAGKAAAERIAVGMFEKPSKAQARALDAAVARAEVLMRDELGTAKSFTLDTEESIAERAAIVRAV